MNLQAPLTLIQRSIAFCMAAMVTLGVLGGIDQLAHQPQADAAWAGTATTIAARG